MCTKKAFNKISLLALFVMAVIFLASCKGGNKSAELDQLAADSLNKELLASDIQEVLYPLPGPFEMTKMLNDIGVTYSSKTLNSFSTGSEFFITA